MRTWMGRRCPQRIFAFVFLSSLGLTLFIHHSLTDRFSVFFDVRNSTPSHTIVDGLLIVNPAGPHPIFQLIREAEEEWAAKHARASTTLADAIAEYKRRYHRNPPLGFDKWWAYVTRHNVPLPDEYDEIYEDIEPFWGIDPHQLAHTQATLENGTELITVVNANASLKIVRSTIPEGYSQLHDITDAVLSLLRNVAHELPPFRFSLRPHDTPAMMSDWRIERMVREAAANGITLTKLPRVTLSGWAQACAPNAPARVPALSSLQAFPVPSGKTFIASHRATMDPCTHPSLLATHGQFLSHKKGPMPQHTFVPQFSLCATTLHHDIRPPVPYGWNWDEESAGDEGAFEGDVTWEEKMDERLGWRGRTTGMYAGPGTLWELGHRARLVTLANELRGNVTVLRAESEGEPVGVGQEARRAQVNPAWMDVGFTDVPVGCDEQAGTCAEMKALWEFRSLQRPHEEGRYKYIIDVDGNGWSGRFKRLISSNALIFKSTIYPEWYMSRIAPWVHYVPIQVSYADLYDALAFFRAHDDLAKRIAKAGRTWSREYWRKEDMIAYFYRLMLEYARVTSLDRASMDYTG